MSTTLSRHARPFGIRRWRALGTLCAFVVTSSIGCASFSDITSPHTPAEKQLISIARDIRSLARDSEVESDSSDTRAEALLEDAREVWAGSPRNSRSTAAISGQDGFEIAVVYRALADYYAATLGMLFKRFEGLRPYFKERRNGGIGAFTPDNVPIFDHVADNAFVIADSNHGFKMIGVGKLVAHMLVHGNKPAELEPFTIDRYRTGGTFGDRNSNCPWV